jgi:hypothetical protein
MYNTFDIGSIETCALTHVPIQYGDKIVRVVIHRRAVNVHNESDYFRDTRAFRDVAMITVGYYDGEGGLEGVDTPEEYETTKYWLLFFHWKAWRLAQTFNVHMEKSWYDAGAESRKEMLELHAEACKEAGRKIKIDPIFHEPDFPKAIEDFARVVYLAYQVRKNLVPPPTGPDEYTSFFDTQYALAATVLMLLQDARQISESLETPATFEDMVERTTPKTVVEPPEPVAPKEEVQPVASEEQCPIPM